MFRVTPEVRKPGVNVMARPLLRKEEVVRRVKAGLGPHHTLWSMNDHPGMLPNADHFDVVSPPRPLPMLCSTVRLLRLS